MKVKAIKYRIFDPETNEEVQSCIIREDGVGECYGSRTGCSGELCGGCAGCILMQASYYGYKITDEHFEIEG